MHVPPPNQGGPSPERRAAYAVLNRYAGRFPPFCRGSGRGHRGGPPAACSRGGRVVGPVSEELEGRGAVGDETVDVATLERSADRGYLAVAGRDPDRLGELAQLLEFHPDHPMVEGRRDRLARGV